MNPQQHLSAVEVRVLSRLLGRAQTLPAAEREVWLAALPPAQQPLVPRLRQRLAQTDLLPAAAAEGPASPAPPFPFAAPTRRHKRHGERIGPYRLLAEIDSSPTGSFWQAERIEDGDDPGPAFVPRSATRRPAALLLPAPVLPGDEQPLLPLLPLPPHAHVLGLQDAGVDDLGRPWRAMAWVDGVTLVEHARRRRLTPAQKLKLLLPVCRALSAAHRQNVAHGDIRPAQLRVDDEGQVLLLDWGHGRALTPPMRDADIQGLGSVLDALFGGRPPIGDVAPVVKRTQQPAPALRYGSVDELAADLQRVVDDRPVRAGPVGLLHRGRLFLRRHGTLLGAGGVACLLLGWVLSMGWQQHRDGQRQAERTERARTFVAEQLQDADVRLGFTPDPAQLGPRLRRALDKARAGFEGEPVLRGQVLTELAGRLDVLGQAEEALLLFQEAHALLQGTAADDDPALHAARAALAQQMLQNPGLDSSQQATRLARQVLAVCRSARCEPARLQAGEVLKRLGAVKS